MAQGIKSQVRLPEYRSLRDRRGNEKRGKILNPICEAGEKIGATYENRTRDLLFTKQPLWPTELRWLMAAKIIIIRDASNVRAKEDENNRQKHMKDAD